MKSQLFKVRLLVLAWVCGVSALSIRSVAADDKPAAKTRDVKLNDITLKLPETWKQAEATSKFRAGQFALPAADGDAEGGELVIFFFGSVGGGGVDPNIRRWIDQFDPKGRTHKLTSGKSSQGEYVLADVTGTYNKPVGPPVLQKSEPTPGSRMLGVILAIPDKGSYFLKLTGPEKTVSEAADTFRSAFGASAKDEKEYSLEQPDEKK